MSNEVSIGSTGTRAVVIVNGRDVSHEVSGVKIEHDAGERAVVWLKVTAVKLSVDLTDAQVKIDSEPVTARASRKLALNPECQAGKCGNCDGAAVDQIGDIVPCQHACHVSVRL